ncbi:MAG: hypothetical protein RMM08_04095 [Armatimonadota bacterium]|nr:hypothetical protein [bacterium]MDW8320525.1 hypothetical protein [Armatimonadota bacterium]
MEMQEHSIAEEAVSTVGEPVEEGQNVEGSEAEPSVNGKRNGSSPLLEPYLSAAPFWHLPLQPGVFHETPLLVHTQLADAEHIVMQMASYLQQHGYEVKAHELRLEYTRLVKISAAQYEQLRHELEPLREQRLADLHQTEHSLYLAQGEFMRAMAAAKLPIPEPLKTNSRGQQRAEPEIISPLMVERALRVNFASEHEVCGEQGIAPPPSRGSIWNVVGQWLFELFAPLAAGLLLGVNLGVITGILSLEVLQRSETVWLVSLAAVLGLFVEKLVGNTAYSLAASAAQASEQRSLLNSAEPFPTIRSAGRLALSALLVLLLSAAIATVDALGLYMLYQERQHELKLTGGFSGQTAPFWVFLVVGAIISAPYIVYKIVRGWREPEIQQREARVAYLQWKQVERRRKEPSVQLAFIKAQEVQNLREQRDLLREEIHRIEERLDAARMECIGSTRKFCEYWHRLTAWLSEGYTPPSHNGNGRNSGRHAVHAPVQTWWGRLSRLFRT